jgi:hypothetical protein
MRCDDCSDPVHATNLRIHGMAIDQAIQEIEEIRDTWAEEYKALERDVAQLADDNRRLVEACEPFAAHYRMILTSGRRHPGLVMPLEAFEHVAKLLASLKRAPGERAPPPAQVEAGV